METIQREARAEIATGPQWKEALQRVPTGAGQSLLELRWSLWIGVQGPWCGLRPGAKGRLVSGAGLLHTHWDTHAQGCDSVNASWQY